MKNKTLKNSILLILWLAYTFPVLADPLDPDPSEDPPYEDPTPIDNWEVLLIIMGIGCGYFLIRQYQRNESKLKKEI